MQSPNKQTEFLKNNIPLKKTIPLLLLDKFHLTNKTNKNPFEKMHKEKYFELLDISYFLCISHLAFNSLWAGYVASLHIHS